MRLFYLLVTAALTALAQAPAIQTGTAGSGGALTLEQALALAETSNPQLHVADANTQGAEAAITTARSYPNPEFRVMAGHQYRRQIGAAPGLLQHYSVTQPLELSSVREARIRAAQRGLEASSFALAESRLGVRAAVKQTFYQALRRRNEIELARQNLQLIEDLRRRIQVQVQVGEAARLELTRADAEVATARTLANSAHLRFINAIAELRTVVSAPLGASVEPRGALEISTQLASLDELRTEMLERHPALAQARAEIERAEDRLKTEVALKKPQPSVYAEWENQPDLGFYRFGIALPVPLWNRRQGPISEAAAAVKQMKAVAELTRLELTSELERAYGLYEVASQQVAAFEQGSLREAEAALSAAEAAFKFGERGIIEVLDAQRILRSVRQDFLSAQFDLQAALIEVERLRAAGPGSKP